MVFDICSYYVYIVYSYALASFDSLQKFIFKKGLRRAYKNASVQRYEDNIYDEKD
jgi:hypothetical protein